MIHDQISENVSFHVSVSWQILAEMPQWMEVWLETSQCIHALL